MEEYFLDLAIKEAEKATLEGEVPVGAVIVKNNEVIAIAHNLKERLKDPTAHAEMLAIKQACKKIGDWRLNGCDLYVTLEPCPMCAATICQSRISKVYIGTFDPVAGACGSVINLIQNEYLKYHVDVEWIYSEKCSEVLKGFFQSKRLNK